MYITAQLRGRFDVAHSHHVGKVQLALYVADVRRAARQFYFSVYGLGSDQQKWVVQSKQGHVVVNIPVLSAENPLALEEPKRTLLGLLYQVLWEGEQENIRRIWAIRQLMKSKGPPPPGGWNSILPIKVEVNFCSSRKEAAQNMYQVFRRGAVPA